MKISIIGTGHVGLVTGASLAEMGHEVLCMDSDESKVAQIEHGNLPFFEAGLNDLVEKHIGTGRLHFSSFLSECLAWSEIQMLCVGTPSLEDGSADIKQIEEVARKIGQTASGYHLIVAKSTVPVTTSVKLKGTLAIYGNAEAEFEVASVPEFLREGSAVADSLHPDRIVIGTTSERSENLLKSVFSPFGVPLILTDPNTAEMVKHAANSFLALKISYINFVSAICDQAGANVNLVAEAMGLDHRIGPSNLQAGVGYGGSCFPKDLTAFAEVARLAGVDPSLLLEVSAINTRQQKRFVEKIEEELWVLEGKTLGVLGLTFKPGTDDIQKSPAIAITRRLLDKGATIKAYDPMGADRLGGMFDTDNWSSWSSAYDVAEGSDALMLLTDWEEFQLLDWNRIHLSMKVPLFFDGRNCIEADKVRKADIRYIGMGS